MKPDMTDVTIPDRVCWLAQDANGLWWGYECEPHQHDNNWYENEARRYIKLNISSSNNHWRNNLIKTSDYH